VTLASYSLLYIGYCHSFPYCKFWGWVLPLPFYHPHPFRKSNRFTQPPINLYQPSPIPRPYLFLCLLVIFYSSIIHLSIPSIHLSYLFICLLIYLLIYLFFLSICPSIFPSVPSIFLPSVLSVYLICPSVYLSVYLSFCISICYIYILFIYLYKVNTTIYG